jgi:hypothetical protein
MQCSSLVDFLKIFTGLDRSSRSKVEWKKSLCSVRVRTLAFCYVLSLVTPAYAARPQRGETFLAENFGNKFAFLSIF